MLLRLRAWHLVLIALATLVLASVFIGVWGFIGTWLIEGLFALVAFLATGGEPGAPARTHTTEMALASVIALVISGPFGFWVIFDAVLDPELRKS